MSISTGNKFTPNADPVGAISEMAVVICSDSGLFWQGIFFLNRVADFDPEARVDLYYYVSEEIPDYLAEHLPERVRVVQWRDEIIQGSFSISKHITQASLLRIYAINELSLSYKRVLYSDIDVFLRWGALSDLTQLPDFTEPVAAVRDRALWGREPERWVARNYLPKFPEAVQRRYFNSGVLVANGPVWRAEEISARALDFLQKFPDVCHYGDQSALNAVIAGRWLELSPSWNWQANTRYDFLIPVRNPRMVHFTGPVKPWKDKWKRFDEYYARAMLDWLASRQLFDEMNSCEHSMFRASGERRRTREVSTAKWAPMEMRDAVKPYLDRVDFADRLAGLTTYGWHDDRLVTLKSNKQSLELNMNSVSGGK